MPPFRRPEFVTRLLFAGLLVALACAWLARSAGASTLAPQGAFQLGYEAAPGEPNDLVISRGQGLYTFDDPGVAIAPTAPCTPVDADTATCPVGGIVNLNVDLADINDSATVSATVTDVSIILRGGSGDDVLTGGPSTDDQLLGDAGGDDLFGFGGDDDFVDGEGDDTGDGGPGRDSFGTGPGDDRASGGPGSDRFGAGDTPDGADVFNGGPDEDRIDYQSRQAPLAISLDGAAGDGEAGENDNMGADVEGLDSGPRNDVLSGSPGRNSIIGNQGADRIDGGAGDDSLGGSSGNDLVQGGSGNDELSGSEGVDNLDGGQGDDSLAGGAGEADVLGGGPGTDLADYRFADDALTITIDGAPNDGVPSENDNVLADVEDILGGFFGDTVVGSPAANEFTGGEGNDTLLGAGGADGLLGERGNDRLNGGEGRDGLTGEQGADTIRSRDRSADDVDCGGGQDRVLADRRDRPRDDCDLTSSGIRIVGNSLRKRRRALPVNLACPGVEPERCAGALTIVTKRKLRLGRGRPRRIKLGTRRFALASGRSATIRLRLTRRGRLALASRRRLAASAVARSIDADDFALRTTKSLTVRAKRVAR